MTGTGRLGIHSHIEGYEQVQLLSWTEFNDLHSNIHFRIVSYVT